jgi:hypothetical protein
MPMFALLFGKKNKFQPADYALRDYPGPGTRNAAFLPGMDDPLFSPTGTGIVSTYAWQLTGRGDYQLKNLVYAGQVQGYATGAFVGSGLLPEPIGSAPPTYATDLQGAAG